jgi:hypothetical protein
MENKDKPAFPTTNSMSGTGISKREYIAAMALQGVIAAGYDGDINRPLSRPQQRVMFAIEHADELLKQLSDNQSENQ